MPSSAVFVVLDAACRAASRSSTVTPGSPSSPCSTLPGLPPPGLKSLQTTPVIPPARACGSTACSAPVGTSLRRDRRSARAAPTSPGWSGVFSTSPPVGAARELRRVDGCALEQRARRARTASLTTAIAALTVPWLGILLVHQPPDHAGGEERDRHRHEDRHLERDREADPLDQHREDRARAPSRTPGTIGDPEEVVLDRRQERVGREQLLVVVEPDEVVAVAVVEAPDDRRIVG